MFSNKYVLHVWAVVPQCWAVFALDVCGAGSSGVVLSSGGCGVYNSALLANDGQDGFCDWCWLLACEVSRMTCSLHVVWVLPDVVLPPLAF